MVKIEVKWWYKDAVDGVSRGTDILDVPKMLTADQIALIMEDCMWQKDPTDFSSSEKMPNFAKNAHSPEPETWKILSVNMIFEPETKAVTDLLSGMDKEVQEIFWSAFKIGAVFGHNVAQAGIGMKKLIEGLEKKHPTPKQAIREFKKELADRESGKHKEQQQERE